MELFCFGLEESNGASLSCCQLLAEVNLRTASRNFVLGRISRRDKERKLLSSCSADYILWVYSFTYNIYPLVSVYTQPYLPFIGNISSRPQARNSYPRYFSLSQPPNARYLWRWLQKINLFGHHVVIYNFCFPPITPPSFLPSSNWYPIATGLAPAPATPFGNFTILDVKNTGCWDAASYCGRICCGITPMGRLGCWFIGGETCCCGTWRHVRGCQTRYYNWAQAYLWPTTLETRNHPILLELEGACLPPLFHRWTSGGNWTLKRAQYAGDDGERWDENKQTAVYFTLLYFVLYKTLWLVRATVVVRSWRMAAVG